MSWYELSNTIDHFDEGTIVNFFDRSYDFKSVQTNLFLEHLFLGNNENSSLPWPGSADW